jgi:DNA repair protein SbcC/Rad50
MDKQQVSEVKGSLRRHFGNAQQVGNHTFYSALLDRAETPVAAYWFDFPNDLPRSKDELQTYVDQLVGPRYFADDAPADLRWNHYIYFVVDDLALKSELGRRFREIAVADRSYARKFVVTKASLDEAISSIGSLGEVTSKTGRVVDVAGTWRNALADSELEFLVDESLTVQDRVRRVCAEDEKRIKAKLKPTTSRYGRVLADSLLDSIDFEGFRPHPSRSKIDNLGTVNLIVGKNGVGKTSLLEAIEYLYCGGTARNPQQGWFTVSGCLKNGKKVETFWESDHGEAKGRLSEWYGQQSSSRGNPLPAAFGRFNFLNTDAAAQLTMQIRDGKNGGRAENLEALSQLIGGAEATNLDRELRRSTDGMIEEQRRRSIAQSSLRAQIDAKTTELNQIVHAPSQIDADLALLRQSLDRIGWRGGKPGSQQEVPEVKIQLQTTALLLSEVSSLHLSSPMSSLEQLDALEAALVRSLTTLEKIRDQQEKDHIQRTAANQKLSTLSRKNVLFENLDDDVASELLEQRAQLLSLNSSRSEYISLFGGLNERTTHADVKGIAELDLQSAIELTQRESEQTEELLQHLQESLDSEQERLGQYTALKMQLLALGRKLIEHEDGHDICPLCKTEFDDGELAALMDEAVSLGAEEAVSALAQRVDQVIERLDALKERAHDLNALNRFNSRTGSKNATVVETLFDYVRAWQEYSSTRLEQRRLVEFAASHQDENSMLDQVLGVLGLSDPTRDEFLERLALEKARVRREIIEVNSGLADLVAPKDDIREVIAQVVAETGVPWERDAFGTVTSYRQVLNNVQGIKRSLESFVWLTPSRTDNLQRLLEAVRVCLLQVEQLLELARTEALSNSKEQELRRTLVDLHDQLGRNDSTIGRLGQAIAISGHLLNDTSLASATGESLQAVHLVADRIFERIHVPGQYQIKADLFSPLVRRDGNEAVELTEVSTGQRAAYALSIFLAMNARAMSAPKVVLLDDPIAHIDDLNALSFLDYLRDVALAGKRQIFFATSDDKVAGLFAHKFRFLGERFREIDLGS